MTKTVGRNAGESVVTFVLSLKNATATSSARSLAHTSQPFFFAKHESLSLSLTTQRQLDFKMNLKTYNMCQIENSNKDRYVSAQEILSTQPPSICLGNLILFVLGFCWSDFYHIWRRLCSFQVFLDMGIINRSQYPSCGCIWPKNYKSSELYV